MSKRIDGAAIGIDLGTTHSCVAFWFARHNHVEIVPNEQGKRVTPSCVAWSDNKLLVGEAAKNQINSNSKNTVFDVKRLMGSRFSDSTVQKDICSWPFKVVEGYADKPLLVFEHEPADKIFAPEEISSMILKKMKEAAEAYIGTKVTDAVITVPAYFTDKQRQATEDAGILAGLNVMRLVSEPTAAAIAYGLDKNLDNSSIRKHVVFSMGAGTFDISLLTMSKAAGIISCTVKAASGTRLGGEDFDKAMIDYCVQEFKKRQNKDVSGNLRAMMRLKVACEKAKRELSSTTHTSIEIHSLHDGIDFSIKLSRPKFEQLNHRLFEKCIEHVKNCLKAGNMRTDDVEEVVIIGGSTRIPKVQRMLIDIFGTRIPKVLLKSINAEEVVARGAAMVAANLSYHGYEIAEDLILLDVTPLSLGIETDKIDVGVTPRNTTIPTIDQCVFSTTVNNKVSRGIDVDDQSSKNIFLHQFRLQGVSPAPGHQQKVSVCCNMDADGILSVSTEVESTGSKNSKIIVESDNPSEDDSEKMMKRLRVEVYLD